MFSSASMIGSAAISFSSVRGTWTMCFRPFRSVHSAQFMNSSDPDQGGNNIANQVMKVRGNWEPHYHQSSPFNTVFVFF